MLTQIDNPTVMYYYLDNFHGQKFSKSDFCMIYFCTVQVCTKFLTHQVFIS